MSNSTNDPTAKLSVVEELEAFLYTPYGVGTLAGLTLLLTCVVWCVGCCVYCCVRKRCGHDQDGLVEATREIQYYGVATAPTQDKDHRDGTLSSGYNTALTTYSLNSSVADSNTLFTTSIDSIVDNNN